MATTYARSLQGSPQRRDAASDYEQLYESLRLAIPRPDEWCMESQTGRNRAVRSLQLRLLRDAATECENLPVLKTYARGSRVVQNGPPRRDVPLTNGTL